MEIPLKKAGWEKRSTPNINECSCKSAGLQYLILGIFKIGR